MKSWKEFLAGVVLGAIVSAVSVFIGTSGMRDEARFTLHRAAMMEGAQVVELQKEVSRLKSAPVYLAGTVESDGEPRPLCVGVIDELRLKSTKPTDFKLHRQAAPCNSGHAEIFPPGPLNGSVQP